MLVLGGLHATAQSIDRLPKLGLLADSCAVVYFLIAVLCTDHYNSAIR